MQIEMQQSIKMHQSINMQRRQDHEECVKITFLVDGDSVILTPVEADTKCVEEVILNNVHEQCRQQTYEERKKPKEKQECHNVLLQGL